MAKFQDFLNRVGSNRDRAALRGILSQFLTDTDPTTFKAISVAGLTTTTLSVTSTSALEGVVTLAGAAHGGLVMGSGTSAATLAGGSTPDKNFLSFYLTSTAASGTTRGIYLRTYLSSGAGGEAARFYNTVSSNTPADTVNGVHCSLSFGASAGNITGLGTAGRFTLSVPNRSLGGTTAAVKAEIWSEGASSAFGGTTSFVRLTNAGDSTGMAAFDTSGFVFDIQGLTANTNKVFKTGNTGANVVTAMTASLRVRVGSTTYYIPLATAVS